MIDFELCVFIDATDERSCALNFPGFVTWIALPAYLDSFSATDFN